MSNLGDSNTPIEGQSFGLPAGAELGEDNGDVVIKDSNGTIILRRNETASEWQFEGTDLSGINAIDASSATLDSGTIATESTDANALVRFSQLSDAANIVTVQTYDDLPDPTTLSAPVIFRVTDPDDYAVPTTA